MLALTPWKAAGGPIFKRRNSALGPASPVHYYSALYIRALRDYADKNGYVVVREYVDEAKSGLIDDRPEFNKMIDEARLPEAPFREVFIWQRQELRKAQVLVGGRIGPI